MDNSFSTNDRLQVLLEGWYPWILALGASVAAFFFDLAGTDGFRDLLQSTVNLSAIVVGFLATAKSILFTIGQKEIVVAMKKTDKWGMLIDYMMTAIYTALILAMASGSLLLVKFSKPERWHHWLACAWVFCLFLALFSSLRVIRFFAKILKMQ